MTNDTAEERAALAAEIDKLTPAQRSALVGIAFAVWIDVYTLHVVDVATAPVAAVAADNLVLAGMLVRLPGHPDDVATYALTNRGRMVAADLMRAAAHFVDLPEAARGGVL